jgi:uncharacterized protein (DUF302 family)
MKHTLVDMMDANLFTHSNAAKFFKTLLLAALASLPPASFAADDYSKIDRMLSNVQSRVDSGLQTIVIQHSRLATEEGEPLSPSIALMFSDPVINTAIVQQNPLAGLDLPFRLLFFRDRQGEDVATFTPSGFIRQRHDFADEALLTRFDKRLAEVMSGLDSASIRPLKFDKLNSGYAVLQYKSEFDFETTLQRFKDEVIGNNSDTTWFGEIDFTGDAAKLGVSLPRIRLLMFGAPAPGAKAMREFKTLGLDAFCQKVLLVEEGGQVSLYSNDIVEFARLHYGDNNLSHRVINFRLGGAYSSIAGQ